MNITAQQRTLLTHLRDKIGGWSVLNPGMEKDVRVTSLVDGGYLKFTGVRLGPLAVDTGEIGIQLTDAAVAALAAESQKPA